MNVTRQAKILLNPPQLADVLGLPKDIGIRRLYVDNDPMLLGVVIEGDGVPQVESAWDPPHPEMADKYVVQLERASYTARFRREDLTSEEAWQELRALAERLGTGVTDDEVELFLTGPAKVSAYPTLCSTAPGPVEA